MIEKYVGLLYLFILDGFLSFVNFSNFKLKFEK
jgi:hypothetical protein